MSPDSSSRCPAPLRLRQHIADCLPEEEEARLIAHLDRCPGCQQTLEALAAGGQTLLRTAREVGQESEAHEGDLRQVVKDLTAGPLPSPTSGPAEEFLADRSSAKESSPLQRLGHFRVLEVVGRGGMGIVLKAFDEQLHRVVAIKVLSPAQGTHPTACQRFLREARAAAAIRDDHVIAIYAVEEADNFPYLVMEYIAGGSLQDRLQRQRSLPLKEILRIGRQIALGLAAAHAQGVVHRDIKPANVLLEDGVERVKLTDFGLACAADQGGLTPGGMIAGTPQYMAPEQARGEAVDARADLFSLGSVLYTLSTGHEPFAGHDTQAVLRAVQTARPQPVRQRNPQVPEWLATIIDKLHAPNPADRFSSAAEVAEVLQEHLVQQDGPVPPPLSRRRWTFLGVGGLLVAALALLSWVGWLGNPRGPNGTGPGEGNAPAPQRPPWPPQVLAILPTEGFFFPDFNTVRNELVKRGVQVVVAAPTLQPAQPVPVRPLHKPVKVDLLLKDAKLADFDALFFCGGKGVEAFTGAGPHAAEARRLIREALAQKKHVAALGMGPVVLADAGVLKGIRATCFKKSQPPDLYVKRLKRAGAVWLDEPAVVSGLIITGRDPGDAIAFTQELLQQLGLL